MVKGPRCKWCKQLFSDQDHGAIDCHRAHPKGIQCKLCLRAIAREQHLVETDKDKEDLSNANNTDTGLATWMQKRKSAEEVGPNGRRCKKGKTEDGQHAAVADGEVVDESTGGEVDDIHDCVGNRQKISGILKRAIVVRKQLGVYGPSLGSLLTQ